MIRTTLDPISLNDAPSSDQQPVYVFDEIDNDLRIYFESEANRQMYMEMATKNRVVVQSNSCEDHVAEG